MIVKGSSIETQESICLDSLTCHAINDAVTAGVHVPHDQANNIDGQHQHHHKPQPDVEYYGIVVRVFSSKVHLVQVNGISLKKNNKQS